MKKVFVALTVALLFFAACTNYGKKKTYGKGEMYYTENITDAEADSAKKFLQDMTYLSDDKETTLQVDKVNDVYKIRIVVLEQYQEKDTTLDFSFKALASLASMQVFDGKPVEVDLCDKLLKPMRTVK